MSYLLDSHAFLWLATEGERRSTRVAEALLDPRVGLHVSAVSAFEFATKQRLGKFSSPILDRWDESVTRLQAVHAPLTHSQALLAGRLAWEHKDPFDRLLAAQAMSEDLTLVTADRAFDDLPGLNLLRW